MRHSCALIAALLLFPGSALAQSPAFSTLSFTPTSTDAPRVARQTTTARSGFTVLVNLGLGIQNDSFLESTATGLAGVNFGVGFFLTNDLAIMFRFSGTNVTHEPSDDNFVFSSLQQVSGVIGGTVQYWPADRFAIEAGAGMGFWSAEEERQNSFGLILGGSGVVFRRGGHNLLVGGEYAPAFTESGTVHNLGITFGYQYHR